MDRAANSVHSRIRWINIFIAEIEQCVTTSRGILSEEAPNAKGGKSLTARNCQQSRDQHKDDGGLISNRQRCKQSRD